MTEGRTRRDVLRGLAVGAASLPFLSLTTSRARAAGLLDKLKSGGVIKIGLANQPPYSGLNPDGTVSGYVPTLIQQIMAKIGIAKVEGLVATYGELIPGLQAGRWDMIGASFRITAERCSQISFADPLTFDGGAIAYVPSEVKAPPKSMADLKSSGVTVGILQGSYLIKSATGAGVAEDKISQFPNNPALIDGLLAKRVQTVLSTNASLVDLMKARNNAFSVSYPLSDDPPKGSSAAFRPQDTDLLGAFQTQLRAMRAAGELNKLAASFGFPPPPPELANATAEQVCAMR